MNATMEDPAVSDRAMRRRRLGNAIRDARHAADLNQIAFGKELGVELDEGDLSQSTISQWELGRAAPEPYRWPAIERVLNMQPGTLAAIYHGSEIARELDIPAVWVAKFAQLTPGQRDRFLRYSESMMDDMIRERRRQ